MTIDPITLTEALRYNKRGLSSDRTITEYVRIAQALLSATPDNPIRCTSQGKWLQVQSVVKKLRAEKLVSDKHDFPVKKAFKRRDEAAFEEKVLTPEQFETLLENLPRTKKGQQLHLACRVSYYSGLRLQETLNLTPQQITLIPDGAIILRIKGKGGKIRKSYLPQEMREEMSRFQGFSISYNYITDSFRHIVHKIRATAPDFPKTSFHGLRHSFATTLVNKGINIKEIQRLLGHYNLSTTAIYLHAANGVPEGMKNLGY